MAKKMNPLSIMNEMAKAVHSKSQPKEDESPEMEKAEDGEVPPKKKSAPKLPPKKK